MLSLARDDSASLEILCWFLTEELCRDLDEEWGMQFGGIVENLSAGVKSRRSSKVVDGLVDVDVVLHLEGKFDTFCDKSCENAKRSSFVRG